ncbi:MAG: DUF547 domain-containing protein [Bacteroidetes bacterium]|nr:DUF547 domain-containing protein [Bacteroidota bacterium]
MVSNIKLRNIKIYLMFLVIIIVTGVNTLKATENFSHVAFDSLLQKNVKDGKVYYQGFNTQPFKDYIYEIAHATPQEWPRDEQLAFWLNTYNACVISNMIIYGSIQSPLKKKGFFDVDKFSVGGMELSLNQIENEVIRANFPTYLVHFGLVCAAVGCPKLNDRAFCSKTAKKQLEINMHEYMTSTMGARLDRETKTLKLSKIMDWYHKDFDIGGGKKKLLEVIIPYLKQEDIDFIKANKSDITIDFFEYDWSSNETTQRPAPLKVKPFCK